MGPLEKTLVTGAGGFIGGRITERFIMDNTPPVLAGVHRLSNCARIGRFNADITQIDILDPETLLDSMEDCAYVIHCAYGSEEVTTRGTQNVLAAAKESDIEQVIHMSSVDVYGDQEGTFSENSPLMKSGRDYPDSKVQAERICQDYQSPDLPITILRPAIVYGPFSDNWTVSTTRRLQSGRWGDIERLDGYCNPVYIDDVVQVIRRCLNNRTAYNEAFNVTDGTIITWNEFYRQLNQEIAEFSKLPSKSIIELYLWSALVHPVRWVGKRAMDSHEKQVMQVTAKSNRLKRIARYLRNLIQETPSLSELKLYRRKTKYPIEKARDMLDYSPNYDLDKGLKLSRMWLNHHRYLGKQVSENV